MGQNSLGSRQPSRTPVYHQTKMGRVHNTSRWREYGKIEVVFLDYGTPLPVWVVGNIDREPSEGDWVLVGYMEGRKDAPYLVGYVRNEAYTSNEIIIGKEYLRFQLPANLDDRKESMLDDAKYLDMRPYVEITPEKTIIHQKGDIEVYSKNIKFVIEENVKTEAKTVNTEADTVGTKAQTSTIEASAILEKGGNITMTGGAITANGEDLNVDLIE